LEQRGIEREPYGKDRRLVPMVMMTQVLLEEPMLDGRQRSAASHQPLLGQRGLIVLDGYRELQADDRIAPELEEVVVNADRRDAEHVLPDIRDGTLDFRLWCRICRLQLRPRVGGLRGGALLGRGLGSLARDQRVEIAG